MTRGPAVVTAEHSSVVYIAAYLFTPVDVPDTLVASLHERAGTGALRGTVLVATEGLNLFLAGATGPIDAFFFAALAPIRVFQRSRSSAAMPKRNRSRDSRSNAGARSSRSINWMAGLSAVSSRSAATATRAAASCSTSASRWTRRCVRSLPDPSLVVRARRPPSQPFPCPLRLAKLRRWLLR